MDRRRFVPSPEGLEGRELLASILTGTNPSSVAVQNLPDTAQQKLTRIERLPDFLRSFQPGRFLPQAAVAPLQADLAVIQGHLHLVPSAVLEQFNVVVRNAIPHENLLPGSAAALNKAFGTVLQSAGVPPNIEADLKADMNEIAKIDALSINPTILATNDYSTVLQTALGVGLPVRTPDAPTLSPADQIAGNTHATGSPQPHLVGTYTPAATMFIINTATGEVIGKNIVNPDGKYSVQVDRPLSPGKYVIRMQAIDIDDISPPSVKFVFNVVAPRPHIVVNTAHPQGPVNG